MKNPYWIDEHTWCCPRHLPPAKYPARVARCLLGCPQGVRPKDQPAPPKAEAGWQRLIDAPEEVLRSARIMDLRKYARHELGIVGVSKMRGGKPMLVPLILEKRAAVRA